MHEWVVFILHVVKHPVLSIVSGFLNARLESGNAPANAAFSTIG